MCGTFLRKYAAEEASPNFFQYITDVIFRDMIKHEFPLISTNRDSSEAPLSYLEKMPCGVLLVVMRHLHEQLQCSAHPQKAELQLCLLDFSDPDISTDESEEWVRSIERGGLKHVSDMTYTLFMSMEQVVHKHLQIGSTSQNSQREITEKQIKDNNNALFYWCTVSAEWEEDTASTLLDMIVKLWITIRGFSGANRWLEKYYIYIYIYI